VELWGLYILCGALLLDALSGEAPNRFHPVAWLGNLISLELKLEPSEGARRQFFFGMAMVILTCMAVAVPLYFLTYHCEDVSLIWHCVSSSPTCHCKAISLLCHCEAAAAAAAIYPSAAYLPLLTTLAYLLFSIYLLKISFSLRGLWQGAEDVKLCLRGGDPAGARLKARALVSRDTSDLSDEQLMSAAVESCAENLCDSFIAPLFYFVIFGLPGAIVYRIVNTFDAMIGYHGRREYTGKFAARTDDVLNFIPARLSALLIVAASGVCRADAAASWRTMLAQHGRTESPNAGWSMSAMAGSLGVRLEKAGAYCLQGGGRELTLSTITHSQQIVIAAAATWATMVAGIEVLIGITG
jgi:adenosylcobinamide-phosphate synthase